MSIWTLLKVISTLQVLELICTREAGAVFDAGGLQCSLTFIREFGTTVHKDTLHSSMNVVSRLCGRIDPTKENIETCVKSLSTLLKHEDSYVSGKLDLQQLLMALFEFIGIKVNSQDSQTAVLGYQTQLFQFQVQKLSWHFKEKHTSEEVRIDSIIIFHLSKLWKAKFFILCDVIFLVRLQGKFNIDHSW